MGDFYGNNDDLFIDKVTFTQSGYEDIVKIVKEGEAMTEYSYQGRGILKRLQFGLRGRTSMNVAFL